MASREDSEELKRQALQKLAEGRAEIAAEGQRLRRELNPRQIIHRTVEKHTVGVMAAAFGLGLVVTLLLVRAHHPKPKTSRRDSAKRDLQETKRNSNPGLLGLIARAVAPVLAKLALSKATDHCLKVRQSPADADVRV